MKWTNKGHQFDGLIKKISPKTKIYVYGAGVNGRDLFERLQFINKVEAFIDNDIHKQETDYCGRPVMSLQDFFIIRKDEHIVIIAQSLENTVLAKNQLLGGGYQEGIDLFEYHSFIDFYLPVFTAYVWNRVYIPTVSMLMTTICNLDCKGCLNFTHENGNKQHYELDRLKMDADILFSKADFVGLFHLCGGEPILYPGFQELIAYIDERYRAKILQLGTTINGTVMPSDALCEQMKKADMTVWVDDYRENVALARGRYEEVIKKLEAYKIKYFENNVEGWIQVQRKTKESDVKAVEGKCTMCNIPFVSLKNQKIYGCNYSDYASEASVVPEDAGDALELRQIGELNKRELVEFVMGYSEKGYYSFCPYCNGSLSINTGRIPVAEQYDRIKNT